MERLLRAINLQPSLSAALNRTTTSSTFLSKTGNEQMCQYSNGGGGLSGQIFFLNVFAFVYFLLSSFHSVRSGLEAANRVAAAAVSRIASVGLHSYLS